MDDEVKGKGNSINYEARFHDPRVGRFLSVDPKASEYPFMSPYCYARNSPIYYIDANGEGPQPPPYIRAYELLLEHLRSVSGDTWGISSESEGTAVIHHTVTMGQIKIELEIEFNKNMSRSDKVGVMSNWGMNNMRGEDPYAFYLFRTKKLDTWTNYAHWIDDWYLKKTPAPIEFFTDILMAPASALYGWSTGEDLKTGQKLEGWQQALSVLDVIPGEALVKAGVVGLIVRVGDDAFDLTKGVKGAGIFGKCTDYAADFIKKFGTAIKTSGGKVTKKGYSSNLDYGIYHNGKAVTENGHHSLVEVISDGKTYVYDNLNPNGMLKSEYIKTLEIGVGTKLYSGEAAYDLFKAGQ